MRTALITLKDHAVVEMFRGVPKKVVIPDGQGGVLAVHGVELGWQEHGHALVEIVQELPREGKHRTLAPATHQWDGEKLIETGEWEDRPETVIPIPEDVSDEELVDRMLSQFDLSRARFLAVLGLDGMKK